MALIMGGAIFTLMQSLLGGILIFAVCVVAARRLTNMTYRFCEYLLNSAKFRTRYDAMKWTAMEISIARGNVQD